MDHTPLSFFASSSILPAQTGQLIRIIEIDNFQCNKKINEVDRQVYFLVWQFKGMPRFHIERDIPKVATN